MMTNDTTTPPARAPYEPFFKDWPTIGFPYWAYAAGFTDQSWHNDAGGKAELRLSQSAVLELWCHPEKPEDREPGGFPQYGLYLLNRPDPYDTGEVTLVLYQGESRFDCATACAKFRKYWAEIKDWNP